MDLCDIILPASTQFETDDLIADYGAWYLQVCNKVIEPLGESMPNWDFFAEWGRRMGFTDQEFKDTSIDCIKQWMTTDAPYYKGVTYELLQEKKFLHIDLPVSVKGLKASLSGPATAAERKLKAGADHAGIAAGVQKVLAETFYRLIFNAAKEYKVSSALIVGGVASNTYIRDYLHVKLNKKKISLWHPQARFSCDNACGCAAFAVLKGENRV